VHLAVPKARVEELIKRLFVLVLASFAFLTQVGQGQVRGVPPSVTSLAPGRQFLPGPSVTSLGPFGTDFGPTLLGNRHGFRHGRFSGGRRVYSGNGAIFVPYPVPVYPEMYAEPDVPVDRYGNPVPSTYAPDSNYPGPYGNYPGPYGSYADPYGLTPPSQLRHEMLNATPPASQPVSSAPKATSVNDQSDSSSNAVEPQPVTVLVFKDGHKLEIKNYAIQGSTLFNFDDKGPRKIALADIDVPATVSANDDHGVDFRVP
jgi:hypothetical protein